MQKKEIKVGGRYVFRFTTGRFTVLEVTGTRTRRDLSRGKWRDVPVWDCTDLSTGKAVAVGSAVKFRRGANNMDDGLWKPKANARVGRDVPTPAGNIHTPNGYATSMKATDDAAGAAETVLPLVELAEAGAALPPVGPKPAPTNGVEATVKPRPAWVPMNKIHEHARVTSMELDFMGRVAAWVKHRGDTLVSIARHPSDAGRVFVVRVVNPDQKLWDHLVACDYTGVNPVESRYIGG